MKTYLIKYNIYLFLIIILSCNSSSTENIFPSVVVTNSESLSQGGVTLTADFQNFSEGDILGFYVDSKEYLIPNPKEGQNTVQILSGLYQDKKYSFYAFIKTSEGGFFTSRTQEFYALSGSFIPKINTITPATGYIGDLIEINFSEKIIGVKKEGFNIKLHTKDAEIIDVIDDQTIVCRVPKFLSRHEYYRYTWAKMSITYLEKVVPCNYEFNIKAPIIDSVSPKLIDWGDEIIIKGDFYKEGYPPDFLTVNINDIPATKITKISPNEVSLEVSIHMFVNNPKILLASNGRGVFETNTFRYYPPEIISFQQGGIGDEIEIIGKYFWPASYVNEVYFDDYKAEIITGESTKLVVKIPEGIYVDNKALLKVRTTDELVSEAKEFNFQL